MKRFHFRLQGLMVVRDAMEKRAREAFLLAQHKRLEESERLRKALHASEAACAESISARGNRLSAVECRRLHEAGLRAEAAVTAAALAEREARKLEESARIAWVEARRQMKLIERLRENAQTAHLRECVRLEQEMLDELAVLRAPATASSTV